MKSLIYLRRIVLVFSGYFSLYCTNYNCGGFVSHNQQTTKCIGDMNFIENNKINNFINIQ